MDQALEFFLSWQTVLLCLLISGVTFVTRQFVESLSKTFVLKDFWTKFLVPAGPIMNGALLGLCSSLPWPEKLGSTTAAHVAYGLICGMASSTVYARAKDFLRGPLDGPTKLKLEAEVPAGSTAKVSVETEKKDEPPAEPPIKVSVDTAQVDVEVEVDVPPVTKPTGEG